MSAIFLCHVACDMSLLKSGIYSTRLSHFFLRSKRKSLAIFRLQLISSINDTSFRAKLPFIDNSLHWLR